MHLQSKQRVEGGQTSQSEDALQNPHITELKTKKWCFVKRGNKDVLGGTTYS